MLLLHLPDAHLDLVNVYGQADGWPTAQAMLHDHREILTSPRFRTTLTALADLYLTNPAPRQLLRLLTEIDESGIETAFALRHADHQRHALLAAWIDPHLDGVPGLLPPAPHRPHHRGHPRDPRRRR